MILVPSGIEIDITSIKLRDFKEMVPTNYTQIVEFENQKWRYDKFPLLDYTEVDVEKTAVDIIINGLRVQDKTAYKAKKNMALHLKKCAGKKNTKPTYQPYEQNDFDLLWIFPNNGRRYYGEFFL